MTRLETLIEPKLFDSGCSRYCPTFLIKGYILQSIRIHIKCRVICIARLCYYRSLSSNSRQQYLSQQSPTLPSSIACTMYYVLIIMHYYSIAICCTCIWLFGRIYIYIYTYIYVYLYIHIHISLYLYLYMYIYIYMYMHTYIHTYSALPAS